MPFRKRASGGGKGRRRKIRIGIAAKLRPAYQKYLAADRKWLRIKHFYEEAERNWVSALDHFVHGFEIANYAKSALEQEHELCKLYIELHRNYPEFLKLPANIADRVLEAARDLTKVDKYARDCTIAHGKYKKIWAKESAKLVTIARKDRGHIRLKAELDQCREKARRTERDFDDFAEKLFSDTSVPLAEKIEWLGEAEKKLARAKIAQEEKEIELAKFYYRAAAQRLKSPGHFLEELGRQVYSHQVLRRLYIRKAGAG